MTRESTDSFRNSLGASGGSAEGDTFVEYLLQQPLTRQSEPAETAASRTSTDDRAPEDPSASSPGAASEDTTSENTNQPSTDAGVTAEKSESAEAADDDPSPDVEQDEAVALALAAQPSEASTVVEPPGATVSPNVKEPSTLDASAPQQPTSDVNGPTTAHPEMTATSARDPLADTSKGDSSESANSPSANDPTATEVSQATRRMTSPVGPANTSNLSAVDASQHTATDARAAEITEKSPTSAKTRNAKATAKSRAAGTKNDAGESIANGDTSPTVQTPDGHEASPAHPLVDGLVPDMARDAATQNPTASIIGNEVDASREAATRAQSLTERLPERMFGGSSPATGSGDELSSADQTRLIQRVARAIEVAPQNGGILRLRLRPPELGAVRLEVALRRGKLTARIETETAQARNILLDQLPQLRERLEEQGIRIERFDVEVGPQDQGDSPSQSPHTAETYRSLSPRGNRPPTTESEPIAAAPTASRLHISATQVNVII